MINPLDLLTYIAVAMILSLAIGGYIGVTFLLTAKVYISIDKRVGYRSLKPDALCILAFIVMLSPLIGTMAYLVSLTAAS